MAIAGKNQFVSVQYDKEKLKAIEKALGHMRGKLGTVMARSLNRTAAFARTHIKKPLARRLGWRQGDVAKYLTVFKASRMLWESRINIPTRPIDAISLRAKGVTRKRRGKVVGGGVSYKDPETGRRVKHPHAFIHDMPKRGKQVWVRSIHRLGYRKYVTYNGRQTEALYRVRGPSLYTVALVHARAETDKVMKESQQVLEKNIMQQVNGILSKRIPA